MKREENFPTSTLHFFDGGGGGWGKGMCEQNSDARRIILARNFLLPQFNFTNLFTCKFFEIPAYFIFQSNQNGTIPFTRIYVKKGKTNDM
jgi:hypothetical protein